MDRNFVAAQRMPREIEEPSAASSLFYALFIVCGRRCPLSMRINAGVGHPGEGRFGKWEAWSAFPGNVLSYTTTTCFRKGRREKVGAGIRTFEIRWRATRIAGSQTSSPAK